MYFWGTRQFSQAQAQAQAHNHKIRTSIIASAKLKPYKNEVDFKIEG